MAVPRRWERRVDPAGAAGEWSWRLALLCWTTREDLRSLAARGSGSAPDAEGLASKKSPPATAPHPHHHARTPKSGAGAAPPASATEIGLSARPGAETFRSPTRTSQASMRSIPGRSSKPRSKLRIRMHSSSKSRSEPSPWTSEASWPGTARTRPRWECTSWTSQKKRSGAWKRWSGCWLGSHRDPGEVEPPAQKLGKPARAPERSPRR